MDPTILIAEDDAELAELYSRYLIRCGYRVLTASGGVECLSIIRNESPMVILASVNLPWDGTDGLLDFLSDEARYRWGPSVILTGCTAEENVAELREQPSVFRYLRKPFLMGRLLDCIRAIESDGRYDGTPAMHSRQQPVESRYVTSQ
jgi:DNA-binding response OmpR family regulator